MLVEDVLLILTNNVRPLYLIPTYGSLLSEVMDYLDLRGSYNLYEDYEEIKYDILEGWKGWFK